MAARPASSCIKHKPRRRNCAPRWRRLIVEQFEPRMLLSSAPIGLDHAVTGFEDTSYAFATSDFPFNDPGDSPPDNLQAVKIATLPALGSLADSFQPVTAGQFIPASDLANGNLRFLANPNAYGPPYTAFTFQVQDTGGTAVVNGVQGVDLDPTPRTMTINVLPVNDPPNGIDKQITILEDHAYAFSATDFAFTDPNDSPQNGLSGVFISGLSLQGGALQLSGVPVVPGYRIDKSQLSGLSFTPAANKNDVNSFKPSFTFQVQDDGGTANGGIDTDFTPNTIVLSVTSVNDAPQHLFGSPGGLGPTGPIPISLTLLEDTARTFTVSDFWFYDPNDTPPNALAAVRISSLPLQGTLLVNGVPATVGQFVMLAAISAGQWQYIPPANANGQSYTSFTIQTQDNGGTANGGVDLEVSPATISFSIFPVNDAPVGSNKTIAVNPNASYTFSTADFPFSDPNDAPSNTLLAVLINTLPDNTAGTLSNNGTPVAAGQIISVSDLAAGRLVFTPTATIIGPITGFTFQVQDNGGTSSGSNDLDLSARTMTLAPIGAPPNHAPQGMDTTATSLEDWSYTLQAADFGFTDPDDNPPNAMAGVYITSLPTSGTLTDNFNPVTAGQLISVSEIGSSRLVFRPAVNTNGAASSKLTFQVKDNGGTASGGGDTDPTPNTMTFSVVPVNDPPSGFGNVTLLEDNAYTFSTADFRFSDAADSPANNFLSLQITAPPASGTLQLNGAAVPFGTFISVASINNGQLRYIPNANGWGNAYASFYFRLQDDGGTANGGTDITPFNCTMTLNVTSVNDAPLGSSWALTIAENTSRTFTASDFGFFDPSDSPPNAMAGVYLTTVPTAGTLKVNGSAVVAGQLVLKSQLDAGSLVFTPTTNATGSPYSTFTFKVKDDGGTVNGGQDTSFSAATLTINVVPPPPVISGQNHVVTGLEDTIYTFGLSDFPFTETFSPPNDLASVTIQALPLLGSLTDNGLALTAGQVIPAADLAASKLQFLAVPNAYGTPYTTFVFKLQDTAGNSTTTANTQTINLAQVNDAPIGTSTVRTVRENQNWILQTSDFGPTDPNDFPANTMQAVVITTLPTAGTLLLNGAAVTAGQTVNASDVSNSRLVFAVPSQTALTTSFTFQVRDNGGTFNGGIDTDPVPKTLTFYMARADQQLVGQDHTASGVEDQPYTFSAADFPFTDTYDPPYNGLNQILLWGVPAGGNGKLTYKGATVVLGTTGNNNFSAQDLAAGNLVYVPAANQAGAAVATFPYYITDLGNNQTWPLSTQTINLLPVNDPPAGSNKTFTTLEDVPYTLQVSDFGFTDPSDNPPNVLSAVRVTALPGQGVLSDNGVAVTLGQFVPVADLTSAKLVFTPAANANGIAYASFAFQVQDNGGVSNGDSDIDPTPNTITFNVTAVNDAPLGSSATKSVVVGSTYTFNTSDFGFYDPSDVPSNTFKSLLIASAIAPPNSASGTFTDGGVAVTDGQVIPLNDISAGRLVFIAPASLPPADPTFTFKVQDNGGTANGGQDTDYIARTMTLHVVPSINTGCRGTNGTIATPEDVTYTFIASNFGFFSLDSPPTNFRAVIITTLPAAGVLSDNGAPITVGVTVPVTDINNGLLRYVPPINANGFALSAFTFRVQDDGGTANGRLDTDPSPKTLTLNVLSVNDAPRGTSGTRVLPEDTRYTFAISNFGFTDPADNPPNAFAGVRITTLPALGTLTLNNSSVNAGDLILASQISTGQLAFMPAANGNGSPYTAFSFQVKDDGGTANGGIDTDPSPKTLTLSVLSVNDAPRGTSNTRTLQEDTRYTISASDFGFSDTVDNPPNNFAGVRITTLPPLGTVTLNGSSVHAGDLVLASQINAGQLVFTPTPNASGSPYTSFTFQVKDDGGTAVVTGSDGNSTIGLDLDPTPKTLTFNVTSGCPLSPTGGDYSVVTTLEDTTYIFRSTDFPVVFDGDSLSSLSITSLPVTGHLTINGAALSVGQSVSTADIAAGNLAFTPATDANGTAQASIVFQTHETGGTCSSLADPRYVTISVNVTSVNDAPLGANSSFTTLEETPYHFSLADFHFTDPRDNPADAMLGVRIDTLPTYGVLFLRGNPILDGTPTIPASDIASGQFIFAPAFTSNGNPLTNFAFRVRDTGGTANGGIDIDPVPRTMTINVTFVNDPPQGYYSAIALSQCNGLSYVVTVSDFNFSDVEDNPPNNFLAIIASTLPATGALTLSGAPVAAGQTIPVTDIAAGRLRFTGSPIAGTTNFTFFLKDDGGTANGGIDVSPVAFTISFSVAPPPVSIDHTVSTLEDTPLVLHLPDFGIADVASSPVNIVIFNSFPAVGTLLVWGAPFFEGQPVEIADIAGGHLTYVPPTNANGQSLATIGFSLPDGGGLCGAYSTGHVFIDVAPVNDSPIGTSQTISIIQGTSWTFSVADFGFSDPNDYPFPNSFKSVLISSSLNPANSASGMLTDGGVPVVTGQVIPVTHIANGMLIYTAPTLPPPQNPTFQFQVQDDGGTANGGVDLDQSPKLISFSFPPPLPGIGKDSADATLEDTALTFSPLDFALLDAGIVPAPALIEVKINGLPASGALTDNGVPVVLEQAVSGADITGGLLRYLPPADANGAALVSFSFYTTAIFGNRPAGLNPLAIDQVSHTLTISVTPVNDPPSFIKGADLNVTDESGEQTITGWASGISAGPPNESEQHVHFVMFTDSNVALFASSPTIDSAGNMTFTPAFNVRGTARITIALADDGGTANGGQDISVRQVFNVNVAKAHLWHNAENRLDVSADGQVVPGDALSIINFINAFGSQAVPNSGPTTGPYYDVNADSFVSPIDALDIINAINTHSTGEGETALSTGGSGIGAISPLLTSSQPSIESRPDIDLITLLALDVVAHEKRRQ